MKYTEFNTMSIDTNKEGYEAEQYKKLLEGIHLSLKKCTENDERLFRTDAVNLYDHFLAEMPEELRQVNNCNTCRKFVNTYGGLVTVNEDGSLHAVMWDDAPEFFHDAVEQVRKNVCKAKVTGVFVTSDEELGVYEKGGYFHMSAKMPAKLIYKGHKTLDTVAADKNVDHELLCKAVNEYDLSDARTALQAVQGEKVRKNAALIGHAKWFYGIMKMMEPLKNEKAKANLLWAKAAEAPAGLCHLNTTKLGRVLEAIGEGYDYEHLRYIINGMTDPRRDQRPQAAPTEGNKKRAEQIVAERGLQNSLRRRFARKEEVKALWTFEEKEDTMKAGVFGNVKTKESLKQKKEMVNDDVITMTWEKFQRTVLPDAKKIEYAVRDERDSFAAILTAADFDAPPIIMWDFEEARNPFNWYTHYDGSYPEQWGLRSGWVNVTAVTLQPNLWTARFEHRGTAVFFLLEGAKDNNYIRGGTALFPAHLKNEFREVAPTIEAYSREERLEGYEEASACGLRLQEGGKWHARFRVETEYGTREYILDRWD